MTVEITDELIDLPYMRHLKAAEDAQKRHDLDAAVKNLTTALKIDPDCAFALHSLSIILADRQQLVAAVAHARRAIAVMMPRKMPYLLANLGSILTRMEHYEAAIEVYEDLANDDPHEFKYWHNLALALTASDPARAIECIDRAMKLAPDEKRLWRDSGLMRLMNRDWQAGFRDWHRSITYEVTDLACTTIQDWRGEPLEDKTIVVYHEQGFGDTIQFCRFLSILRSEGARVILAVPAPLIRLMEMSGTVDEVLHFGDPAPPADYQIPLMGTFAYRDIGPLIDVPLTGPYLTVPDRGPRVYRAPNTLLTIGICWAGNPHYGTDQLRSMPFENFLSIADIPGVQLVSLQKGDAAADIDKHGASGLIANPAEVVVDLADMTRLIDQLDLVVSVDTSALHLAGALDKPCLGLLPYNSCWRWGIGTNETPFYSSVELVRQTSPGDWIGVMIRVRKMISEILERDVGALDRSSICGVVLDGVGTT